jgi:holin-like protein
MDKIKGFLVILLCLFAGNLLSSLTGLPVPGSIFGMIILLALLLGKAVRLETVEPAANLLVSLLLIMILPGGVDLMNSFGKMTGIIPQLLLVSLLSTLLVIASSAWATQLLMRWKKKDRKETEYD